MEKKLNPKKVWYEDDKYYLWDVVEILRPNKSQVFFTLKRISKSCRNLDGSYTRQMHTICVQNEEVYPNTLAVRQMINIITDGQYSRNEAEQCNKELATVWLDFIKKL